jgi:hypothetical protein
MIDAFLLAAYLWQVDWDLAMKAAKEQAMSDFSGGKVEMKYLRVSPTDSDVIEDDTKVDGGEGCRC